MDIKQLIVNHFGSRDPILNQKVANLITELTHSNDLVSLCASKNYKKYKIVTQEPLRHHRNYGCPSSSIKNIQICNNFSLMQIQNFLDDLTHHQLLDPNNRILQMLISMDHHLNLKNEENNILNKKLQSSQELIEKLRIGYYKEIIQVEGYSYKLEAEIQSLKHKQDFEILSSPEKKVTEDDSIIRKIHFFDGTEQMEMSTEVRMLLNSKIDKIYSIFNEKLANLKENNEKLAKQVTRSKILSQNSYEMNIQSFVKKLLMVSQDPAEIWEAIETTKPQFFEQFIIEKYGIGPNYYQKIISGFEKEVKEMKKINQEQIEQLIFDFKNQIKKDEIQIDELQQQIQEQKFELQPLMEKLETKILHQIEMSNIDSQKQLENLKYDEIAVLEKTIKGLTQELKLQSIKDSESRQYELKQKEKERLIQMVNRSNSQNEELIKIEKYLKEHKENMEIQANWKLFDQTQKKNKFLNDKINQLEQDKNKERYEAILYKTFNDKYIKVYQMSLISQEILHKKQNIMTKQHNKMEQELNCIKKLEIFYQNYIKSLENELKKVEKILPLINNVRIDPLSQIKKNAEQYKCQDFTRKYTVVSKMENQGTLTTIFDLKNDVQQLSMADKILQQLKKPVQDQNVGEKIEYQEIGVQTQEKKIISQSVQTLPQKVEEPEPSGNLEHLEPPRIQQTIMHPDPVLDYSSSEEVMALPLKKEPIMDVQIEKAKIVEVQSPKSDNSCQKDLIKSKKVKPFKQKRRSAFNFTQNQKVFEVKPYGINSLKQFLERKIEKDKGINATTQTNFYIESPRNNVQKKARTFVRPFSSIRQPVIRQQYENFATQPNLCYQNADIKSQLIKPEKKEFYHRIPRINSRNDINTEQFTLYDGPSEDPQGNSTTTPGTNNIFTPKLEQKDFIVEVKYSTKVIQTNDDELDNEELFDLEAILKKKKQQNRNNRPAGKTFQNPLMNNHGLLRRNKEAKSLRFLRQNITQERNSNFTALSTQSTTQFVAKGYCGLRRMTLQEQDSQYK